MFSLDLSDHENAALTSALSTYGSPVKTVWQQVHAATEQIKTDTETTSPDGSQVTADATGLAAATAQLEAARTQLDNALLAALTPEHLRQLKTQLTAHCENGAGSKAGHILTDYARQLEKQ